jgi:hypothetical protein
MKLKPVASTTVTHALTWRRPGFAMIIVALWIVSLEHGILGALVHVLAALAAARGAVLLQHLHIAAGSVALPITWRKLATPTTVRDTAWYLYFLPGAPALIHVVAGYRVVHVVSSHRHRIRISKVTMTTPIGGMFAHTSKKRGLVKHIAAIQPVK